ncbi:hypothetical protein BOTBODRAFT_176947 [Botryobasidium botryosum FD-172 SS1]|uniref:Uncharacterized protein n=1 Tax=Botryobasidium botryosum (strain FD-172 SS1) TaxID=930990 RepID=A0A067M7K3_BOTB1|nr:hypothetical protein BOTBODRAFT_176947 [Botryobasidium botryosum FD-172 SS1]
MSGNATHFTPKKKRTPFPHTTKRLSLLFPGARTLVPTHSALLSADIALFPSSPSPVYNLVQQRSYEWKTSFGKAAFTAVSELWASDEYRFGTALGRAEYVKWALGWRKPFSWENGYDFINPYHGPLVLTVLAKHFDEANSKHGYGNPCSALALSATAVKRALVAWSTGNLEKATDFGTKVWHDIAGSYMLSVLQLKDDEWVSIINNALALRLPGPMDIPANPIPDNNSEEDDRSLLVSGPQLPSSSS